MITFGCVLSGGEVNGAKIWILQRETMRWQSLLTTGDMPKREDAKIQVFDQQENWCVCNLDTFNQAFLLYDTSPAGSVSLTDTCKINTVCGV